MATRITGVCSAGALSSHTLVGMAMIELDERVHLAGSTALTECCGRAIADLPVWGAQLTTIPDQVTCLLGKEDHGHDAAGG